MRRHGRRSLSRSRRTRALVGLVTSVTLVAGLVSATAAAAAPAAPERTTPPGPTTSTPALQGPDPSQVPAKERDKLLGSDWTSSKDRASTAIGDQNGFTVYSAKASSGYTWTPLATLAIPGIETDRWIGNTCLTEDGSRMGVVYGTRAMTNEPTLFDAGAWGAIVDMATGEVTQIGRGFSLAYFNPGCGEGNDIIMSAFTESAETRLLRVDAAVPSSTSIVELPFEAASAVPVATGVVAGVSGALIHVATDGTSTTLAATTGVPYDLTATASTDIAYVQRKGEQSTAKLVPVAPPTTPKAPITMATGPTNDLGLQRDSAGHTYVTGKKTNKTTKIPAGTTVLDEPTSIEISTMGRLFITETTNATDVTGALPDGAAAIAPIEVSARAQSTGEDLTFVVEAGSPVTAEPAMAFDGENRQSARQAVVGDPNNPIEAEATCAIPRNDPANQALQPKPRQVEWAVNQAVTGDLNKARTSPFLAKAGLNGSTPQGLFPRVQLTGGGRVPSQVMLGIIAQESNLWQASRYTTPGVTGNPLIGNFYGNDVAAETFTWTANFAGADCGYGVSQVTDGMRKAGSEKPGETALSAVKQRAVALDYGTNIAAGLQILSQKWNQTRAGGLVVNDGNPAYVENWFYAIWAYNSGFYPEADKAKYNGAWGVGWANNPANPKYKQSRTPFLENKPSDAAKPQEWPYPEKVLGFAAWSLELYEDATTAVPAFRPAWWTASELRTTVKPPLNLFCVPTVNNCNPAVSVRPNAPGLSLEPSGPCIHTNADKLYDLRCWMNGPVKWKNDCQGQCGNELLRFSTGYAEQADGTAFSPNCSIRPPKVGQPQDRNTLPSSALIVDDTTKAPQRTCTAQPNQGSFQFTFGSGLGGYPAKIDTHQLGAGWNSHFWFAHTRVADSGSDLYGALDVTGKWTLNQSLAGKWTRVFVHLPDHGAWTQQAAYKINLGDGTIKTRIIPQRTGANTWVSLGVFPMKGTPSVTLSNLTYDGEGLDDVAWDAVAFQPLAAKPANIIVGMGDSFSSGEGSSTSDGGNFYRETDNNGKKLTTAANPNAYTPDVAFNRDRNACHRSDLAWSRLAKLPGQSSSIGDLADSYNSSMDYHLVACSGALTQHVLPYYTAPVTKEGPPINRAGFNGKFGKYREVSQLDSGFVDENTTMVTISIGGNDSRFSDIVTACAGFSNCAAKPLEGDTAPMQEATMARIDNEVRLSIVTSLLEIRKKAPNAKIVLMGYPNLFDSAGTGCVLVRADQASWLKQASTSLNAALVSAKDQINSAGLAGSGRVVFGNPVDEFGSTHNLCEVDNWLNALRTDLTPGDQPTVLQIGSQGIVSAQSVHPNALGFAAYARKMEKVLAGG